MFLELTRMRDEIKGLKPLIQKKDRTAWNKIGEVALPARAVRLNLIFFYQRYAYSYRNSASYGYRRPAANFPLPGDGEELWALSVSHLMKMASDLRDDRSSAGSRSPSHARRDEHHVGPLQRVANAIGILDSRVVPGFGKRDAVDGNVGHVSG